MTEEVSFQDVEAGTGKSNVGWKKIQFCADKAAADGLRYFWIDTCCINQSNKIEVADFIKSMYLWYAQSKKCFVYLEDVDELDPQSSVEDQMRAARWFTRGWTLQGLIAPKEVEFYSSNHTLLGTKKTYSKLINETTKIPVDAFCNEEPLSAFSLAQRFHWRSRRSTKRDEDTAYSLLAILEVDIEIIYGGENQAFSRLLNEVARREGGMLKRNLIGNAAY
ncbi:hypothetical protein PV08_09019 [Exophiala spinifera]|uniref:Heterokaryon incompatibility domain-containing protein n=1 Tax=Exophiala spinifera TaxID=91928 RepID=A0A0D1ZFG8_9EURO|nr:uncharacterized protein PV08_09019 [Exophiala spinifera]KIW11747.1 hypothetical protein PV08_09019 [Exophiala spinifera]